MCLLSNTSAAHHNSSPRRKFTVPIHPERKKTAVLGLCAGLVFCKRSQGVIPGARGWPHSGLLSQQLVVRVRAWVAAVTGLSQHCRMTRFSCQRRSARSAGSLTGPGQDHPTVLMLTGVDELNIEGTLLARGLFASRQKGQRGTIEDVFK